MRLLPKQFVLRKGGKDTPSPAYRAIKAQYSTVQYSGMIALAEVVHFV